MKRFYPHLNLYPPCTYLKIRYFIVRMPLFVAFQHRRRTWFLAKGFAPWKTVGDERRNSDSRLATGLGLRLFALADRRIPGSKTCMGAA
jgi:hypothetical protein